jgi:hypothetical protein
VGKDNLLTGMIIGIDPGSRGAAVAINRERDYISECRFTKDISQFYQWLRHEVEYHFSWETIFYFEDVHSFSKDAKSTAFTFGRNTGFIEGQIQVHYSKEDIAYVQPQTWQREFNLGAKFSNQAARKRAHLIKAKLLFPKAHITLDTCDAYLIAEYGYRKTFNSTLPDVKPKRIIGAGRNPAVPSNTDKAKRCH